MKFFLIILILFGIKTTALATENHIETEDIAKIPTRIQINYTIKTDIGNGELNEIVDIDQNNALHTFNITSDAQATGVFKMINPGKILRSSQGIVTEHGLQPNYYSDKRVDNQPSLALFDWENHVLTLKNNEGEILKPLTAGTLDRLSLSYNFIFTPMSDMQMGNLLAIHVTDGHSLQLMQFKVSRETLSTPLGKLDTIVLTKQQTNDDKMQKKIWLSPEHHMIPVHIQSIEKDGLEIESMIAKIDIDYTTKLSCCAQ